ncbi:MAG: hypothetical protein K9L74_00860 [Candidatus Izimaplasma sp.]|nr:hypothetical protein [Candidatus Izimaplasma bacterium]
MQRTSSLKASLLGSASALGLNWIYDRSLLDDFAKKHKLLFLPIEHELYKKAKSGFDVYPNHQAGDLDFLGEVIYKFSVFYTPSKTPKEFRRFFYEQFNKKSHYDGYIEHYGEELLKRMNLEKQNNTVEKVKTEYVDKQLIGPAFLLALYDYKKHLDVKDEALKYAKVLTAYDKVSGFIDVLYELFTLTEESDDKKEVLKRAVKKAPKGHKKTLELAINTLKTDKFIDKYSGVACGVKEALPLILHIIHATNNYEGALRMNAQLGGASSARGMFISAYYNLSTGIPDKFVDKLNVTLD